MQIEETVLTIMLAAMQVVEINATQCDGRKNYCNRRSRRRNWAATCVATLFARKIVPRIGTFATCWNNETYQIRPFVLTLGEIT